MLYSRRNGTHAVCVVLLSLPQTVLMAQTTTMALQGTSWTVVEISGTAVQVADAQPAPHLEFSDHGSLTGGDGCNVLLGGYTVKDDAMTLGPLAASQMACPGTGDLSKRFRSALSSTRHWKIVGKRLHLIGATGNALAVFERQVGRPTGL